MKLIPLKHIQESTIKFFLNCQYNTCNSESFELFDHLSLDLKSDYLGLNRYDEEFN
jgi:hypothetical protein